MCGGSSLFFGSAATPWVVVVVFESKVGVRDPGLVGGSEWAYCLLGLVVVRVSCSFEGFLFFFS